MNNKYKTNFDSKISINSKQAKQMFEDSKWDSLNEMEKDFIKKNYMGRQLFRGFYTDFSIARLMAHSLFIGHSASIFDPCTGSGRLLEYLPKNLEITCCEIDKKSAKLCQKLHPNANIIIGDALSYKNEFKEQFDFFIASPPWGLDVGYYENYELNSEDTKKNSTSLFIELCINSLKKDGRGVVIVPSSFYSRAFNDARRYINREVNVLADISYPSTIYASSNILVDGHILLIEKSNTKKRTCFYQINEEKWEVGNSQKNDKHVDELLTDLYKDIYGLSYSSYLKDSNVD